MTPAEVGVTINYLRECFDVDFAAGILRWRFRPRWHFWTAREWRLTNTQLGGKRAGSRSRGYFETAVRVGGEKHRLRVHRIVWAMAHGSWPSVTIDHKNGVKTDNRLSNLREATRGEQRQNTVTKPGRSGFRGVRPNGKGRFQAYIMINRKFICLGQFSSPEAAHARYLAAKVVHHPFNPGQRI
jgi:hypothetical protein